MTKQKMLDQKEIVEATDRLRRHYEAMKSIRTLEQSPYYCSDAVIDSVRLSIDRESVVTSCIAYIQAKAEREARDAMPLTAEDLVKAGWDVEINIDLSATKKIGSQRALRFIGNCVFIERPSYAGSPIQTAVTPCRTYGDFRRLCEVFGITTKREN